MTLNRFLLAGLLSGATLVGPALAQPGPGAASPAPAMRTALPLMTVHRHPSCGCCGAWVEHMRHAGFNVQVNNVVDVMAPKQRLGVPADQASCHTTEVGGYVVEGHVPASDILKLLRDKPRARGLVLPGMPLGSPGMEAADGSAQAYTVQLLGVDGSLRDFSHHPARTGRQPPSR